MTKRLLAVLLAVMLVASLGTVAALADGGTVRVRTEADLREAINDAQNNVVTTIILDASFDLTGTESHNICAIDIQAGKNIKLDLNGNTISCRNDNQLDAFYVFHNFGTLEVTDSSQAGSGMIYLQQNASISSSYNYAAVVNNTSTTGSFKLSGGTLKVESNAMASIAGIYIVGGTTNQISGGKIEVIKTYESSNACGALINGDTVTVISDGSVDVTNGTSGNAIGIEFNGNSWQSARHPVISGSANITAKQTGSGEAIGVYGSANITGGTVTATNGTASNKAYAVKGKATSEATISGGTFNGNVTVPTTGSLVITGGKFDEDVDIESYLDEDAKVDVTGQVIIGEFTAEIGNKGYATLQSAVSAANNGEIVKLLKDTNEDITVSNNKNVILNLGNNTLTNVSGDTITVEIGSTLTIEGNGTVDNKTNGCAAVFNNGTVIINGGTYDRTSETGESADVSGGNSWYTICNHGDMTINAGVTVKNTGSFSSMIENGYYSYNDSSNHRNGYASGTNHQNPVLRINGGEFVGGLNSVKNDDGGILNITDGNFSNTTQAAVLNWNEATISGGTFTVTAENCNAVLNGAYSSPSSENDKGQLTITGGSFISTGNPVKNNFTGSTKPAVSGGNFSASVDEEFLTDDIKAELYSSKNPEAPYSYYKSVEDAQQAAEPGDIITDLSNVEAGAEKVTVAINNGIGNVTTAEVNSGSNIILPAAPDREGYMFVGWRDANGKVYAAGTSIPVADNTTFTAVWREIVIPDPHAITVVDPANGSIKTSLSNASKGAVITVTATPDKGYELAYITVDGEKITGTTFTMPDKAVTVSAVFVPTDFPFVDVKPGDWHYDYIAYVYENGLMNGVSATTFEPNANMTRAMVWTILARIDGETITGADWAADARAWAMANGVSDGTDANGLVTREQFVTMLWRFAGEPTSTYSLAKFTDNGSVSDWAETAMAWAVENGIITGVTDTTIVPQGTATRAQCAAMLMRFVENV